MPHSDKVLLNEVGKLYDDCMHRDSVLAAQVNDCVKQQANASKTIYVADSLTALTNVQIADANGIIALQRQEMTNLNKTIKANKTIAVHQIIGWACGGFAIGVAVPVLIYFIKH